MLGGLGGQHLRAQPRRRVGGDLAGPATAGQLHRLHVGDPPAGEGHLHLDGAVGLSSGCPSTVLGAGGCGRHAGASRRGPADGDVAAGGRSGRRASARARPGRSGASAGRSRPCRRRAGRRCRADRPGRPRGGCAERRRCSCEAEVLDVDVPPGHAQGQDGLSAPRRSSPPVRRRRRRGAAGRAPARPGTPPRAGRSPGRARRPTRYRTRIRPAAASASSSSASARSSSLLTR